MRAGIPDRARHRDEERRVLVAVADPGAQHLARRRDADRRLLLEEAVDVPREALGAARVAAAPRTARAASARMSGSSLSMSGSGARCRRASGSAGRVAPQAPRIAQLDDVVPDAASGAAIEIEAPTGRAPSSRMRSRSTSRASSIRSRPTGTMAAASSRSVCTWLGTAMARAFSGDSRMVSSPSGLSSRTTSPVSVTQDVVWRPENSVSTRNAGIGAVPGPRTSSRLPTSTTIGALCSVAASKIVQRCRAPGTRPPLASRRDRFSDSAGGSGISRTSVRVLPAGRHREGQTRAVQLPAHFDGAGPWIERELERAERKLLVDLRRRPDGRGRRRAEQRHLQPAVFLELEPGVRLEGLADGEPDLLAAVVDAVPRRRPNRIPREIGREGG